jgi:hypothetical protein
MASRGNPDRLRLLGCGERGDDEGQVPNDAWQAGRPVQARLLLLRLPLYDAFVGLQRQLQFDVLTGAIVGALSFNPLKRRFR